MSLSVKMSGENVADLSVATGKNDTEMGSHCQPRNLLIGASKTFTDFSEDLPSAGSTVCPSGAYVRKHNPWLDFSNVPSTSNQPFPTNFTTLPTISFVIPNLNGDMHDGTISQADTWLQNNLGAYIQFVKTNNSLLIMTWDEDDGTNSNHIPTILFGGRSNNALVAVSAVCQSRGHSVRVAAASGFHGEVDYCLSHAGFVECAMITSFHDLALMRSNHFRKAV